MSGGQRVLICGNYGRDVAVVDGQTIKTRTLRDALVAAFGEAVSVLDTSSVLRNPVSFYAAARQAVAGKTHVILLPGPRGVYVLIPMFLRWGRKHRQDVRYVVIGGFLPDFLKRHPWLRRLCGRLDGIYVETESMARNLTVLGLDNVRVLPNFRAYDLQMPRRPRTVGLPIRLVFCSRVFKEKGVEEAIAAVEMINAGCEKPVVALDIFGPITESYESRFAQLLELSPGSTYKGVVPPANLYTVLQDYDLMLFPTFYWAEGFPGAIVDAFIAGVPVLASDWSYNRELIREGETGTLCAPRSLEDLVGKLRRYVEAPDLLAKMRPHCIEHARAYHVERALKDLIADVAGARNGRAGLGSLQPAER